MGKEQNTRLPNHTKRFLFFAIVALLVILIFFINYQRNFVRIIDEARKLEQSFQDMIVKDSLERELMKDTVLINNN